MRKENGVYHKTFYCSDLANCSDGDRIFDIFLLSDLQYCSNDRGVKWLSIKLEDKSGEIKGKLWSDKIEMEYEGYKNQIIYVSGKVTYYAGIPDLTIEKMKIAKIDEIVPTEVVKILSLDKSKTYKEQILCLMEKIQSKEIRNFTKNVINKDALEQMSYFPVRLLGHHNYCGGLLAHTCEVATASYYYAKATDGIREQKYDLDLVLAGALLHDMASLLYFKRDGYSFSVSSHRKLLGWSYIAHQMLWKAYEECKKSDKEVIDDITFGLLVHIIEASHGEKEPMNMEAMLVKRLNLLSAEHETYEIGCNTRDMYQKESDFLWSKDLKREICKMRRDQTDGK